MYANNRKVRAVYEAKSYEIVTSLQGKYGPCTKMKLYLFLHEN